MIQFKPACYLIRTVINGLMVFFALDAQAFQINAVGLSGLNSYEQSAVTAAIGQIDSLFANNISLKINFSGTMPAGFTNDLGSSSTFVTSEPYINLASVVNQNYGSNILSTTINPTGGSIFSPIYLSEANLAALNIQSAFGSVGTVYLNSNDFNSASNTMNLEGVVEHEITEILGRISGLASTPAEYNLLDLYRYTSAGQISTSASDQNVYFSVDGGKTVLMDYNTSVAAGDLGDWATSGSTANALDAFNYASPIGGSATKLSAVDILEMQALGYKLNPVPLPSMAWSFIAGLFGLMVLSKKRGALRL